MSFVDIKALYTIIGNNLDADLEVKYKKVFIFNQDISHF